MVVYCKTIKVQVVCPVCKRSDIIGIPEREIKDNSKLTTVSIQRGLICPHHFQIFIDKNMKIRGYQKVDFELNQENILKLRNGVKAFNLNQKEKHEPFENIIFEGNDVKYKPLSSPIKEKRMDDKQEIISKRRKMTIKDIYEEFWEFIDDDNEKFSEFMTNDKRRKDYSTESNLSESYYRQEIDQEI